MRLRNQLHISKLDEFKKWLESKGWVEDPGAKPFEKLRMKHPKHNAPLLVYKKDNDEENFTTRGLAFNMLQGFLNRRQ